MVFRAKSPESITVLRFSRLYLNRARYYSSWKRKITRPLAVDMSPMSRSALSITFAVQHLFSKTSRWQNTQHRSVVERSIVVTYHPTCAIGYPAVIRVHIHIFFFEKKVKRNLSCQCEIIIIKQRPFPNDIIVLGTMWIIVRYK